LFLIVLTTIILVNDYALVFAFEHPDDFKGTDYCVSCHKTAAAEWDISSHSQAYTNSEFQDTWEELGFPVDCLSCHTTGYNEQTNDYKSKEVNCEACHLPGSTMEPETSSEFCGSCHSTPYPTYEEWRDSGPSHGNAECILCHDKHTNELTKKTSTATCGQCHDSHVDEIDETKHGESNVECSDCHLTYVPADFEKGEPANTGHSFNLASEDLDCSSCHDRPLSKHGILGDKAYACLSCHGDIHELKLELINMTKIPLDDSVQLCAQCHNERYTSWEKGTHGKFDNPKAQCVECHDAHDPVITNISTLPSIPLREAAKPVPMISVIIYVGIIGILGATVLVLRRQAYD
jgi:hypothetical protein